MDPTRSWSPSASESGSAAGAERRGADTAALASIVIWAVVTLLILGWIVAAPRRVSREGSEWIAV